MLLMACAECGLNFAPHITKTKICPTCVAKKNSISDGIPKALILSWCKYCRRYNGPPWTVCELESKELLALCLKKVRGLKGVKLVDAIFIWTEEHSRRIKLQLTIQKTVNRTITLEQSFVVEFTVVYTQCDDCKQDFTPHTWKSCVQLRQKSTNKKTLFYLEQLMLKYNAHAKASQITKRRDGLDFFFASKNHGQKLVDFVNSRVPTRIRESKELVSQDDHSNIYKYKHTWMVEMPKVCREDLVILPRKLCKANGGVNRLNICYKVGVSLHFYDPVTLQKFHIGASQFFNNEHEIEVVSFKSNKSKFMVKDIYADKDMAKTLNSTFANIETKFAQVEVTGENEDENLCTVTHMGHFLRHGDIVLGYDLRALNSCSDLENLEGQRGLPEVLVVRKFYDKKRKRRRVWKLKRMQIEEGLEEEKEGKTKKKMRAISRAREEAEASEKRDYEMFLDELEQSKSLRSKINLFVDEEKMKEVKRLEVVDEEEEKEMVKLEELMKEMNVPESKEEKKEEKIDEDDEINDFIQKLASVKVKKD